MICFSQEEGMQSLSGSMSKARSGFPTSPSLYWDGPEAEAKPELHQPGILSTKTSPCPLVMDLSSDLEIYFFVKPLRFDVVPAAKFSPSY